jgi:hypothetical protein
MIAVAVGIQAGPRLPLAWAQWRPPVPVSYKFDGFLAAVGRKD